MATAFAADDGKLYYALGYCFLSQTDEIKDTYRHLLHQEKTNPHIYNTSLSLRFTPYYQFNNGLRADIGIGPMILMTGDAYHLQMPVNACLGYSFLGFDGFIPYFKAGIAYHLASGDYYKHSYAGFYGAVGFAMFKEKPIRLGVETAYDGARIALDSGLISAGQEKIKTGEITFYVYADF